MSSILSTALKGYYLPSHLFSHLPSLPFLPPNPAFFPLSPLLPSPPSLLSVSPYRFIALGSANYILKVHPP